MLNKNIVDLRLKNKENLRKKLINKEFSLIASNCTGMFMLWDLGLPYRSPFVNLYMYPRDFIKFLSNIEYYTKQTLIFIKKEKIDFPIAKLDDIEIYFQHFSSKEDAEEKWYKRIKRINYDNLFIIMTDRDGCTKEDIVAFSKLNFKNKVIFTHIEYPDIDCAVYIPGYEKSDSVGMCHEYKSPMSIKRSFEIFDYVAWFNGTLL